MPIWGDGVASAATSADAETHWARAKRDEKAGVVVPPILLPRRRVRGSDGPVATFVPAHKVNVHSTLSRSSKEGSGWSLRALCVSAVAGVALGVVLAGRLPLR